MCVCVFVPVILDVKFVGCTSRGHTGGKSHRISHPPSFWGARVHVLLFIARRFQPFLSLVDREIEFCVQFHRSPLVGHFIFIFLLFYGFYGDKILYKNLDLTQDFPNKILFHFLWEQNLVQNLPTIFRWPEMCSLGKILAQDFQMAAVTKILIRREKSIAPLLSLGDEQKTLETQKCTQ